MDKKFAKKHGFLPYFIAAVVLSAIVIFVGRKLDKRFGYYRFELYMQEYGIDPEEFSYVDIIEPWGSRWRVYVVYKDEPVYTYLYDYYMSSPGSIFDINFLPDQVIVEKDGERDRISGEEYENLKHPTFSLHNPPPDFQSQEK